MYSFILVVLKLGLTGSDSEHCTQGHFCYQTGLLHVCLLCMRFKIDGTKSNVTCYFKGQTSDKICQHESSLSNVN